MPLIRNFRDLLVWQKAHILVLQIYKATQEFPDVERYGITNQIRRASTSTAANIVEGWGRRSLRDRVHFLNMSHASNDETKYFLSLAKDLNLLKQDMYCEMNDLANEIGAMLYSLIESLQTPSQ